MPSDSQIEELIRQAIEALENDPKLKMAEAARRIGAPYRKLLNRQKSIPPSKTRGGHNKKLLEPADETLKEYLHMLYNMGRLANKIVLIRASNSILRSLGSAETISRRWAND